MAKYEVHTCPLCETPMNTSGFPAGTAPPTAGKNGFAVTVGFSNGGWGRRENALEWSNEICCPCFAQAMELIKPLEEFLHVKRQSGSKTHFTKTMLALGFSR